MIITAKFNGLCVECGGPMPKGSEIDYSDKKARHPGCVPIVAEEPPGQESFGLADKLGFRYHPWDELQSTRMANNGSLRELSATDRKSEERFGSASPWNDDSLSGLSETED